MRAVAGRAPYDDRVQRYTREQVERRRRVAVGVMGLVLLLAIAITGATASRLLARGAQQPSAEVASTPARTRAAEPAALRLPETPAGSAALAALPAGTSLEDGEVLGIDVSAHQGEIAWPQVREQGISFAYIKATEGVGHLDERLNTNWAGAHRAGIARGAYHYFTLCSSGAEQAEAFLAAVPPDDSALPPAVDLELGGGCTQKPSRSAVADEVDVFITAIEKSWGRQVVVYSSHEWRDAYPLPDDAGSADATLDADAPAARPLWISDLDARPDGAFALWQTRFDARLEGIDHDVDLDVGRVQELTEGARLPD